ncbi:MAG: hypothetical protein JW885_11315 [Deltaproteobacteria bacterium]|nr:hypothetical protein [Candidatus Zymogenaceae bacterium]
MNRAFRVLLCILAALGVIGFSDVSLFETAHFTVFWSGEMDKDGMERLTTLMEDAYREYLPLFQEDPAARRPIDVVVFASTGDFCHHTGLPWWSASAMIDGAVYLQPLSVLAKRNILNRVAAHETALVFIHERYGGSAPPWYAEGLAMYLAGEGETATDGLSGERPEISDVSDINELLAERDDRERNAWGYVLAYEEVADLIDEYGLPTVAGEGERFFNSGLD